MSRVDLHVHSNASDGRYSPAEIVKKGAETLVVMALTDHDTVNGLEAAIETAGGYPQFKLIPGVEISADVPEGEAHFLGYFIDHKNDELCTTLARTRNARQLQAQKMIARLKELGMPIEWERVKEIAGTGSTGRPHIAQALLEKGYVSAIKEAFNKYLHREGPAYVEREKMTPAEATGLINRTGGLAVMAHPFTLPEPEKLLAELSQDGLAGIETYYGSYSLEQIQQLLGFADRYKLIPTGGSDYHGLDDAAETPLGGADVPMASVERLVARAKQADRR